MGSGSGLMQGLGCKAWTHKQAFGLMAQDHMFAIQKQVVDRIRLKNLDAL